MLRVGLTGPAGAGKSTVARGLEARGVPVLDADRTAHELYVPGSDLVQRIVDTFGEAVRDPSGGLDRRVLGGIVFGDPARLAALNALVHPVLVEALKRRFDALERSGAVLAVVDAALLLQWRPRTWIDVIVAVTAPRGVRGERLTARGLGAEEAARRLDLQVDDDLLLAVADWVVVNDGSLETLEREMDILLDELNRLARER